MRFLSKAITSSFIRGDLKSENLIIYWHVLIFLYKKVGGVHFILEKVKLLTSSTDIILFVV